MGVGKGVGIGVSVGNDRGVSAGMRIVGRRVGEGPNVGIGEGPGVGVGEGPNAGTAVTGNVPVDNSVTVPWQAASTNTNTTAIPQDHRILLLRLRYPHRIPDSGTMGHLLHMSGRQPRQPYIHCSSCIAAENQPLSVR